VPHLQWPATWRKPMAANNLWPVRDLVITGRNF
jgi:hypothetical protein